MQHWPKATVAIVPIMVGGAELHVALDVGVDTLDSERLREGTARAEGDFVIYDGPPCKFTLAYHVVETGYARRVGLGDGILQPRHHCAIQIAPPAN